MKATPKVSVITSAYNHAWCLEEAIQSVLNQTFQDFELVIVDDGSVDGTRELLRRYQQDDRIRSFFEAHRGASLARNKSIEEARGEYIAILDADDVWLRDKLERQVAFLDKHPEISLIHGFVEIMDREGRPLPRETSRLHRLYEKAQKRGEDYIGLSQRAVIFSSSVVVRKECLDRIGYLLDPKLESMQDLDLYLRMTFQGYRIGFLNGLPVARYRYRGRGHRSPACLRAYLKIFEKHLTLLAKERRFETLFPAYRNFLLRTAICYYALNEFEKFREFYVRAVRYDPKILLRLQWLPNLLASFFPPKIVTTLRGIKDHFLNGI